MNDEFLDVLRQEPSPEFARRLKSRLDRLDAPERRVAGSAVRWLAAAASIALVAVAFTLPSVRAGAQAFLDLFRVANFAGVAFDPQRLSEIDMTGLDVHMFAEQIEVLENPGAPVSYASPPEAGAAAGIHAYTPAFLPAGMQLISTEVTGQTAFRFTASTAKLRTLLDALGLRDVTVPLEVDGQQASVRIPPIVTLNYEGDSRRMTLVQSRAPDVSFPAGLDLAGMAEIGLRILGLDRNEAYRFAQSVDWRTTLLVPVPVTAATFRQVDVQGQPALLIESSRAANDNVLLWSLHGETVYVLRSNTNANGLLEIAQTLQ